MWGCCLVLKVAKLFIMWKISTECKYEKADFKKCLSTLCHISVVTVSLFSRLENMIFLFLAK